MSTKPIAFLVLCALIVGVTPAKPANATSKVTGRPRTSQEEAYEPLFKHFNCEFTGPSGSNLLTVRDLNEPFILATHNREVYFLFAKFAVKVPGKHFHARPLVVRRTSAHHLDDNTDMEISMSHSMPLYYKYPGE